MDDFHAARPVLVVDNSRRINIRARSFPGKVCLEFFKRPGREVATRLDAIEKLPVIDDNRRQPSFGDSRARTELFRFLQKLISQGHFSTVPVSPSYHAVSVPQLSTGFVPRAKLAHLRDGSFAMSTLIERIDECLTEKGWSDRAASLNAGHGADFIRNIRNGKSIDPRRDNLDSLAEAFGCSYIWLATGNGQKERYEGAEDEREKLVIQHFRSMTPDRQATYIDVGDYLAHPEKKTG